MTTRRSFLLAGAAAAAAVPLRPLLGGTRPHTTVGGLAGGAFAQLPAPGSSGINHIVVLCMENRSFDHMLGWLPGASGKQAGLSYRDKNGVAHSTYHLTTFQGCGHPDPDHSYAGARTEYDGGKCDGWLRAANDTYAIGYYRQSDLPFLGRAAPAWTVCDNYFAATAAPTFPNRLYMHSAQTDRLDNTVGLTSLPTIWDRLGAAGVSHAYYYSDLAFLSLWGLKYLAISRPWHRFLADAANGTLPAVSYLDPPFFLDAIDGTSADDHPHGDIRNGEQFMNAVYRAVTTGPGWPNTLLAITFDEWGGFFEHVPPSTAPDTRPAVTGLRGFRVPCLVVSPRARRGSVAHGLFDHTSILKLIEWRYGLAPLTPRDRAANNLASALDFTAPPNLAAPQWQVHGVIALPCVIAGAARTGAAAPPPLGAAANGGEWSGLRQRARAHGWRVPG